MKLSAITTTVNSGGDSGGVYPAPSQPMSPVLGQITSPPTNCTAGLTTLATIPGPGVISSAIIRSHPNTSTTHQARVTIDGVVVGSGSFTLTATIISLLNANIPLKFNSSVVIEYTSPLATAVTLETQHIKV